MIEADIRRSIYALHQQGMSIREIARRFQLDRKTVRLIIQQKGMQPDAVKKNKIVLDTALLSKLYGFCNGRIQRMHEIITESHGISISYSTLCARVREFGLATPSSKRCARVADEPGCEMQHDTSVYKVKTGDTTVKLVASLLYYRYSKIRYVKFYRSFNRFRMQCFLHEALNFWGYSAPVCIIDNTNLARLRGSGKHAVIVAEMEDFARQRGFEFVCHEIGHANRKAGNERSFFTLETNFFPGRSFTSMQDLNTQALQWATVRMPNRAVGKSSFIPAKAYMYEQAFLHKIPANLPAPYQSHTRLTDQYGYISFGGNFYWVPGTRVGEVVVLEYDTMIQIYLNKQMLVHYPLACDEIKNQRFSPPGQPLPPYQPKNRKRPTNEEEKKLRTCGKDVDAYLSFALKHIGRQRHRYIRQLFGLYQKLSKPLFIDTLNRALTYRITNINTLQRIALLLMRHHTGELPRVTIDDDLHNRPAYQQGLLCDDPDISAYDAFNQEDEDG